jgi:tetratricopeptide (TPR) repeat protein
MKSEETDSNSSPPIVVSPALRKKLQQCYEHGTKLMQQDKYDFDYAHSLLVECVANDPGNLLYVEALLQNLQQKYHNNKRGAFLAFGGKGGFKKALARKDWANVLKLGPDVLKTNPWDVGSLRGLADACAAFGYIEVELRYLRNALDANPKDPEVNKHCAQSLARIGQFDQAIACWNRVDEARRGDVEAQRMISDLQIAKTQGRRSFGKGPPVKPIRSPAPATEASTPVSPTPRREIQLTPRQQLEQAIVNSPADVDSYLELAKLHVDEDRLGEAARVLTKALAASGNQFRVQERLEDVEILRKRQQLTVAEQLAGTNTTATNRELARQLRDDLNRLELDVFDRRAQRYPADLDLKFQLGLRLKQAGKYREAIACLEQVRKQPGAEASAQLEIGECLQRQKKYEQALKHYWMAVDKSAGELASPGSVTDSPDERNELRKLALYRIAVLAEGLGNIVDAERSLGELLRLDPRYRDAASRMDKIRDMRHKQA